MSDLFDLYQFEFFRNGVIVATLAGALCGFVGVYVVLRNMSYIGHGMSHAIFGGFAASALLGVNYFLGAGVWGLASALAIASITRRRGLGSDAVIGVITTASFAIGLILGDLFHGPKQNFDAALFGSILGISDGDIAGDDPRQPVRPDRRVLRLPAAAVHHVRPRGRHRSPASPPPASTRC